MNVRRFITKSVKERGFNAEAAEAAVTRVLGNLAVAGVRENHEVTALTRTSVSNLLDRLERKLGNAARVVADPKENAPIRPGRRVDTKAAPKRTQQAQPVGNPDSFDHTATESYANALRKGEDPVTGAKLSEIELMPGVKALHNPMNRVVYPIPGNNTLPERV